ncbi:hypothetical protein [Serratia bockelmannii]|uniref:hypothetical protein n=1 Tax=Serratia bockelmannii TaxID=2703793 RepID=UPI003314ACBD
MDNPVAFAEVKAERACNLWEVILEKIATEELTPQLAGLLYLACDLNQEIYRALEGVHHA